MFRYGDNASVWIDCVEGDKSIRIGLGEGWVKDGVDYRKAIHSSWTAPKIDDTVSKALAVNDLEKNEIVFAPLILGAYRRIQYREIEGMKKETLPIQKRRYYREHALESVEGGYVISQQNAMDCIIRNDIEGIKKSIEQLDTIVHPNNTIVNEIKIKLAELILGE